MDDAENDRPPFDELREFEPFDWPGRELVEQDNMGNWGFWLLNFDGAIQDTLLDPEDDCTALAEMIAEQYIADCVSAGYAMPADFDETGELEAARKTDHDYITAEFTAYLRSWRAAIAQGRKG